MARLPTRPSIPVSTEGNIADKSLIKPEAVDLTEEGQMTSMSDSASYKLGSLLSVERRREAIDARMEKTSRRFSDEKSATNTTSDTAAVA
jgi:hypothetical protein